MYHFYIYRQQADGFWLWWLHLLYFTCTCSLYVFHQLYFPEFNLNCLTRGIHMRWYGCVQLWGRERVFSFSTVLDVKVYETNCTLLNRFWSTESDIAYSWSDNCKHTKFVQKSCHRDCNCSSRNFPFFFFFIYLHFNLNITMSRTCLAHNTAPHKYVAV